MDATRTWYSTSTPSSIFDVLFLSISFTTPCSPELYHKKKKFFFFIDSCLTHPVTRNISFIDLTRIWYSTTTPASIFDVLFLAISFVKPCSPELYHQNKKIFCFTDFCTTHPVTPNIPFNVPTRNWQSINTPTSIFDVLFLVNLLY